MGKWMPIETAPRDGTAIIGFWINTEPNITCGGRVDFPNYYLVWWLYDEWQTAGYDHMQKMAPTHWMPLPEPPEAP